MDETEAHGEDEVFHVSENVYRVPDSVQKFTKVPVLSMGWVRGAERVRPFRVAAEVRMVSAMREELETLGVRVSQDIDHSRMGFNTGSAKYAFIGGSKSKRTAAAMRRWGKRSWRLRSLDGG